jgi:tRNA (cytidine/uridine-2'-O-)-methyltransferase
MNAAGLRPHRLQLVLVHPQIAPNTGNIARLCVATGTHLHLVRPMGFVLSDRQLKRSAMDYWPRLKLTVHDDLEAFLQVLGNGRAWLLENGSDRTIWDADFVDGDWLLLGSETAGLPCGLRDRYADRLVAIPQVEGERCLNVSTAAGIGLFAALRAIHVP